MKGGVPEATLKQWRKKIEKEMKKSKTRALYGGELYILIKTFSEGAAPGWSAMQAEYIAKVAGYKAIARQSDKHIWEYDLWVAKKRRKQT